MYKVDLEEMYDYYIRNVSWGNYPISLELARYLYDLCWEIKPRRILDRGSGFSSFVFRKYALMSNRKPGLLTIDKDRALDIYTVDNKAQWLDKTKDFILYCGLAPTDFYIWPDFLKYGHDKRKYDLILEDYSFPTRVKSLPKVLDMLDKNGYLILDDAHIDRYKSIINKKTRGLNVRVLKETEDEDGRYAVLVRGK